MLSYELIDSNILIDQQQEASHLNSLSTSQDASLENKKKERDQHSQSELLILSKKIGKDKKNGLENEMIQLRYKRKKRKNQYLTLKIEYPFRSQYIFHLSGHILTEINPSENNSFQICVRQIEKTEQNYIVYPQNISYLKNFDQIIFMLENSQSQDSYVASQLLKGYQRIIENSKQVCIKLKQSYDDQRLLELQQGRYDFKKQFLQNYIKNNLSDEFFYVTGSVNLDLYNEQSYLDSVRFSKGIFALLGVDQKGIENMLFKHHMLFWMLLPEQRRLHFVNLVNQYLLGVSVKQSVKDFHLQTIDSIPIKCNLSSEIITIPYPPHLTFSGEEESFNISMDNLHITKFEIDESEIKKVIDLRSSYEEHPLEDFEYSMLSQIFIDKFYPQFKGQIHTNSKVDKNGNIVNYNSEPFGNQKRVSYRSIIQQS